MNKKAIAINGQGLTLKNNGGAGKYVQQLYSRFIDCQDSIVPGFYADLIGFEPDENTVDSNTDFRSKTFGFLQSVIRQSVPPLVLNGIQKISSFRNKNGKNGRENFDRSCISISNLEFCPNRVRLFHELTNFISHRTIGKLCLSTDLALVVTFLDIQDLYYPEYFSSDILTTRRLNYSLYKDRADLFLAISEFTKQTMVEKLGISSSKIKVTHLASDDLLIYEPLPETNAWVESFGRFLIYPAKVWKHKNHDFLLQALGKRSQNLRKNGIKILLTGGFNRAELRLLNRTIHKNGLHSIVVPVGFVSDEKLQALLRSAEFLVFPSLFEGFGMPVLEAMNLGCPVISSNAGSLPEIAGDAAIYFDPTCQEEFVAILDKIIGSFGIDRNKMIENGFENCKKFSWDKTYSKTIEAYKTVL